MYIYQGVQVWQFLWQNFIFFFFFFFSSFAYNRLFFLTFTANSFRIMGDSLKNEVNSLSGNI